MSRRHFPSSELYENLERINPVLFAQAFGMKQKGRIDTRIAERNRVAVGKRLKGHHRRYDEFCRVEQTIHVQPGIDAEFVAEVSARFVELRKVSRLAREIKFR